MKKRYLGFKIKVVDLSLEDIVKTSLVAEGPADDPFMKDYFSK